MVAEHSTRNRGGGAVGGSRGGGRGGNGGNGGNGGRGGGRGRGTSGARRNGSGGSSSPGKEVSANLPPCRVFLRSRDGIEVFEVPSERSEEKTVAPVPAPAPGDAGSADAVSAQSSSTDTNAPDGKLEANIGNSNGTGRSFLLKGTTSFQVLHPDGLSAFVHRPDVGIFKIELEGAGFASKSLEGAEPEPKPFLAESARVQVIDISPNGSYLLTWERPPPGEAPNLKVWSSETGQYLAGFRQKALRREAWPHLQWTHDESVAFLLCTNEVRVFRGQFNPDQEARYIDKIQIPGISSLSVGPSSTRILFVTFSPNEKKSNKPSRACLYEYELATNGSTSDSVPAGDDSAPTSTPAPSKERSPLMTKSMFQAEEMNTHWNPRGDSALVALQSSVDVSGQSYYGSTVLYLMSPPLPSAPTDKRSNVMDPIEVPLPQEGPVLDVAWMPNPSAKPQCFVVVAGRMPSMTSLHNGVSGKPTFVFGNAHRNTIAWAPHGRFVCIAGFGNLAGGMTFWDRNKLKQIPPAQLVTASCTVGYGWSPDSRLFISSTTSPRMNVDNGLKLFRYNGDPVDSVPWDNKNYQPNKLLQASFIPKRLEVYPDRPQSPSLREAHLPSNSSTGGAVAEPPAPPPGRYIPPSARNRSGGTGTSLADRMRAEKEGGMRGAQKVSENDRRGGVVGATNPHYGASNINKKAIPGLVPTQQRRGKPKKSDEKWVKMSLEESILAKEKAKEEAKAAKEAKEEEEKAKAAEEESKVEKVVVDPGKRERKIKKILKQIEDLKEKDAESLDDDQKKKIEQEAELRKELDELAVILAAEK